MKPNDIRLIREDQDISGNIRTYELCEHRHSPDKIEPDFKTDFEQFHWNIMTFESVDKACDFASSYIGKECFLNPLFGQAYEWEIVYTKGNKIQFFAYIGQEV